MTAWRRIATIAFGVLATSAVAVGATGAGAREGVKLPPFERVRQYFGICEAAVVTVDTGWLISGQVCR